MERSRYAAGIDELRSKGQFWRVVAFAMVLSNVMLSFKACTSNVHEKTIVVPPIPYTEFWVQGNDVSPSYLETMARYFSGLMLTYDPLSFDAQKDIVLRYADPLAHAALAASLVEDSDRIKRNGISEVFYPAQTRVRADALEVAFTGDVVTLIGQARAANKRATYVVKFTNRDGQLYVVSFNEAENESDPFGDKNVGVPGAKPATPAADASASKDKG